MDVGKGREQERKLFRHSDCRKHPPLLTPGGLIPAYIQVNVHAQMTVLNRLVYNDERSGVEMQHLRLVSFVLLVDNA